MAETDFHQAFWQKKAGDPSAQTITSPAAKVHFDQISTISGLQDARKADTKKAERVGNINYTVEVAVPLASTGLKDDAGRIIGFDWAGLSEGRVGDRPGSTELLPHTWGTLTFFPTTK